MVEGSTYVQRRQDRSCPPTGGDDDGRCDVGGVRLKLSFPARIKHINQINHLKI